MATTITVQDSTLERFKELKAELNEAQDAPNHNADSFLNALLDTWEAADDGYYTTDAQEEAQEIIEQLKAEIDGLAFQGGVFDDEADRIINRIDDLEAQLPRKVKEELQR